MVTRTQDPQRTKETTDRKLDMMQARMDAQHDKNAAMMASMKHMLELSTQHMQETQDQKGGLLRTVPTAVVAAASKTAGTEYFSLCSSDSPRPHTTLTSVETNRRQPEL